jgi:hypothetical protein
MHIFDLNRFLLGHVYKWNTCIVVVVVVVVAAAAAVC